MLWSKPEFVLIGCFIYIVLCSCLSLNTFVDIPGLFSGQSVLSLVPRRPMQLSITLTLISALREAYLQFLARNPLPDWKSTVIASIWRFGFKSGSVLICLWPTISIHSCCRRRAMFSDSCSSISSVQCANSTCVRVDIQLYLSPCSYIQGDRGRWNCLSMLLLLVEFENFNPTFESFSDFRILIVLWIRNLPLKVLIVLVTKNKKIVFLRIVTDNGQWFCQS